MCLMVNPANIAGYITQVIWGQIEIEDFLLGLATPIKSPILIESIMPYLVWPDPFAGDTGIHFPRSSQGKFNRSEPSNLLL